MGTGSRKLSLTSLIKQLFFRHLVIFVVKSLKKYMLRYETIKENRLNFQQQKGAWSLFLLPFLLCQLTISV